MKKIMISLLTFCLCLGMTFPCFSDVTSYPELTEEDIAYVEENIHNGKMYGAVSSLLNVYPNEVTNDDIDSLFNASDTLKAYYGFNITDLESLNEKDVKAKCEAADTKLIVNFDVNEGSVSQFFLLPNNSLENATDSASAASPSHDYKYKEVLKSTLDSLEITNGNIYIIQCGRLGVSTNDNYVAICYPENQSPVIVEVYLGSSAEDRVLKTQIFYSLEEYIENLNKTSHVQEVNILTPKMKAVTIALSGVIIVETIIILLLILIKKRKVKN